MKPAHLLLFSLALLSACSSPPALPPTSTTSSQARILGLVEVTISPDGQLSSFHPVQDGLRAQANLEFLSKFTFTATSGPTAINDAARSRRFITTGYNVTNKSSAAINNLMLVAVNRPDNLGGTAFATITLSDGSKLLDANLARAILPAHGMQDSGGAVQVNPSLASLQVIPSSLAADLTATGRTSGLIAPANTLLDYAFAVRRVGSSNPGTLGVGETGTMALAFSTPVAASPVKSVSLTFAVVTDDTLTFTESLEQQSETQTQLNAALLAQTNRTATEFRRLPGSTTASTVGGVNYSALSYPAARTALSASGFARELTLTAAPRGVELVSSATNVTAEGNITLTATVEQSYAPVSSVNFKKTNAVSVGTATTAPYGTSVALKGADNGTKSFTAQVTDGRGLSTTSAPVDVNVAIPILAGVTQFGTSGNDVATSTAVDSSGNVYVTGYVGGNFAGNTSAGETDAFIVKYNSSGKQQWVKQFGTDGYDGATGIAVDSGGDVYVTGYVGGNFAGNTSAGETDAFIVKYDSSGKQQWAKQFGTDGYDGATGIAVDSGGNVYATGHVSGTFAGNAGAGSQDAFIVKYDSSGKQQWVKQFGTDGYDGATGIALDSGGNVYATGHVGGTFAGNASAGSQDALIVKYDSSGKQQWVRQFGTDGYGGATGIAVDSGGNVYATGHVSGTFAGNTSAGSQDAFIVKYNASGNQQWVKQFGTNGYDGATGIAVDSGGNVYATGYVDGTFAGNTSAGDGDAFIVKYNSSGNQQWVKQFGTNGYDQGNSTVVDTSGHVYATGYMFGTFADDTGDGDTDAFIVRYDSSGTLR